MGSTDNTNGPGHVPGGQFPMAETIEAALPLLRRPFSPSAVRAKVQNLDREKPPKWGQVIRYIDARLVSECLNLVAGGKWSYHYAPLDPALRPPTRDGEQAPLYVVCSLTVLGQTHTDVANEALLRDEYERWLQAVGIAAFGEPLDHGPDQAEAVRGGVRRDGGAKGRLSPTHRRASCASSQTAKPRRYRRRSTSAGG